MAVDIASYLPAISVAGKFLIYILAIIFLILGVFLISKKKKQMRFFVQIYERGADGIPIPVSTDTLVEKKYNKGKNTVWMLTKAGVEAHPPVSKFIYKRAKGLIGTQQWVDYIREATQWIPVRRLAEAGVKSTDDHETLVRRMLEIWENTPEHTRQKYFHSPFTLEALATLKHEPMDYDLNERTQTEIMHRDQLYADKQNWMQQYGPMVGLMLAAGAIIVVAYLGFNFASGEIGNVVDAANEVAMNLGTIAKQCMIQPPTPPVA